MILVDTSVWIEFLRGSSSAARLASLLEDDAVILHPWVLGELAVGHLGRNRSSMLRDLRLLPAAPVAADDRVLDLVDRRRLFGRGLSWVDVHMLAAALDAPATLWSADRALSSAASALGISHSP